MRRLIYPGSFDPLTIGHLDIIRRASLLCDELVVALMINRSKRYVFSLEERRAMILLATRDYANIKLTDSDGLLADLYRQEGACGVVRGLRQSQDYLVESAMAEINRDLESGLETIMLQSDRALAHVSSSLVRELAAFGADYSKYIPQACLAKAQAGFKRHYGEK